MKFKVWWFWVWEGRSYPTSETWSNYLQMLIDQGCKFEIIDNYYANFGPEKLWITNMAYASFETSVKIGELWYARLPNKYVGYQLVQLYKQAVLENRNKVENEIKKSISHSVQS